MSVPKININYLETTLYEWEITFGQEKLSRNVENSISACLEAAASDVPDSFALVEVTYRGMHMGTFSSKEILKHPVDSADPIASQYGSLIQLRIEA